MRVSGQGNLPSLETKRGQVELGFAEETAWKHRLDWEGEKMPIEKASRSTAWLLGKSYLQIYLREIYQLESL